MTRDHLIIACAILFALGIVGLIVSAYFDPLFNKGTKTMMTEEVKKFCIDIATNLFREGTEDWLNGMEEPKEHQGQSYYTGYNEAKKMYPNR